MNDRQLNAHGSSGRDKEDASPVDLANTKIALAAANLSRMLNEEMNNSPASLMDVSIGMKHRLDQAMQNIRQGNVKEDDTEQTVLIGALGELIKMFEHKNEQENKSDVQPASTAEHSEEVSQEPAKRFQRGLWAGRIASDGVRYWKKDGQWCLVSPRCRLHGGDNGECSGDEKRIKHQGGFGEKTVALERGVGGSKRRERRTKAATEPYGV